MCLPREAHRLRPRCLAHKCYRLLVGILWMDRLCFIGLQQLLCNEPKTYVPQLKFQHAYTLWPPQPPYPMSPIRSSPRHCTLTILWLAADGDQQAKSGKPVSLQSVNLFAAPTPPSPFWSEEDPPTSPTPPTPVAPLPTPPASAGGAVYTDMCCTLCLLWVSFQCHGKVWCLGSANGLGARLQNSVATVQALLRMFDTCSVGRRRPPKAAMHHCIVALGSQATNCSTCLRKLLCAPSAVNKCRDLSPPCLHS